MVSPLHVILRQATHLGPGLVRRREIALRINYLIYYHTVLSILLVVLCEDIILVNEQETDVGCISTALWTASPRTRVQIPPTSFSIPQGAIPCCLSFKG